MRSRFVSRAAPRLHARGTNRDARNERAARLKNGLASVLTAMLTAMLTAILPVVPCVHQCEFTACKWDGGDCEQGEYNDGK